MTAPLNNGNWLSRRWWPIWAVGVVLAVVLLASFMSRGEIVPVVTATVARHTIRSVISTNGKIEPVQNFEAHAPVGTTVKKLLVKEGDHVRKGQLLVQLNDAEVQSQVARALAQVRSSQADVSAIKGGGNREELLTLDAQLVKARTERDTAKRNLEALQRLQQKSAASPGEVKEAEEQLERAEADSKLLQQKQNDRYSQPEVARVDAQTEQSNRGYSAATDILRQMNIRAPFDGVVYSLPVHQGAYVNPGDLVLQAADLSKVLVRAFVDEPDIGRLVPGQVIEVAWDALPGRIWKSSVNVVPAAVKLHGTRNVGEITCVVDNRDFKLLPNINVGVTIVTAEHRDVITVPREAVRQDDSKTYVYQIVQNELQHRDIQTSISNLTQVEVTSGLVVNDVVALTSTNFKPLRPGVTAKVVH
ncbi:MAG: efflux RND transporter periplasmic adaptor subunit [Acidobacteriota bacterium]|nr:efflux RND transporter periplasmic adaptor subunit [Acidobacteriota bacterium]